EEFDAMSDAFEATASFVAAFTDERIARAAKDPNHTERTERWLAQQGVQRQPLEQLAHPNDAQNPGTSIYRPRTAPPASVAPDLTTSRFSFASPPSLPSVPSSGNNTLTRTSLSVSAAPPPALSAHSRSLSVAPTFLRTTREEEEGETNGPPSPIETSIHVNDVMNRSRAVSIGEGRLFGEQIQRAGPVDRTAALSALSNSAFNAGPAQASSRARSPALPAAPALSPPVAQDEDKDMEEDQSLTGDKGETASEVAAMFAGW
ncbi:hypothetical protein JCM11641_007441, partial [Rhodosporidiobolus odoratus]